LYLRHPDYENIWSYKESFPNRFCITHELEKVKKNGLPESEYNKALNEFDHDLVSLFEYNKEGLIILVETYCGNRNYWYFISSNADYNTMISHIKNKYPANILTVDCSVDTHWGFLEEYPIKLYR
jgi:hypothetical protein